MSLSHGLFLLLLPLSSHWDDGRGRRGHRDRSRPGVGCKVRGRGHRGRRAIGHGHAVGGGDVKDGETGKGAVRNLDLVCINEVLYVW
jgi:hypothetical protein